MREAVAEVRTAIEGGETAAIRSAMERLTQSQHAIAQILYQEQAPAGGAPPEAAAAADGPVTGEADQGEVIDAEYEDVN